MLRPESRPLCLYRKISTDCNYTIKGSEHYYITEVVWGIQQRSNLYGFQLWNGLLPGGTFLSTAARRPHPVCGELNTTEIKLLLRMMSFPTALTMNFWSTNTCKAANRNASKIIFWQLQSRSAYSTNCSILTHSLYESYEIMTTLELWNYTKLRVAVVYLLVLWAHRWSS